MRTHHTLLAIGAAVAIGAATAGTSLASTASYLFGGDRPGVSNIELAQSQRNERKKWRYQRRDHGERFHSRRGNNRYQRDGWWYARPFWDSPSFGITIAPRLGGSNAHVRWCDDRYRSYNPETDMFLGYDGDYHYCNSPYR